VAELITLGMVTVAGIPERGIGYRAAKSYGNCLVFFFLWCSITLKVPFPYLELPVNVAHASYDGA
jgi:hypothetical protein